MSMYTVVVYKYQLGPGGEQWDNLYEIVTDGTIDSMGQGIMIETEEAVLVRAANAIVSYERTFHLTTTFFDRVSVRTWEPDTDPYNGNELISIPLGLFGQRSSVVAGAALGLDDTYFVRRQPRMGNLGKICYRGVLSESDSIVGDQGLKQLALTSPLLVSGDLWLEARAFIEEGFANWQDQGGDEWAFAMIHKPTSETVVARPIVSFVPGGIRPMQLKKKHSNRPSAAAKKNAKITDDFLVSLQKQLDIINEKLGIL